MPWTTCQPLSNDEQEDKDHEHGLLRDQRGSTWIRRSSRFGRIPLLF
jgi:hypothetical protein